MKKTNLITMIPGLTAVALITIFLSGKIIDIPKGTHKGGIISAIGVGTILITIFLLILIFKKIFKHS